MTTRMISPDGGATHAYGSGEIARLEKLGWKVETPVTGPVVNGDADYAPQPAPTPAPEPEPVVAAQVEEPPVKRKYTRKG